MRRPAAAKPATGMVVPCQSALCNGAAAAIIVATAPKTHFLTLLLIPCFAVSKQTISCVSMLPERVGGQMGVEARNAVRQDADPWGGTPYLPQQPVDPRVLRAATHS